MNHLKRRSAALGRLVLAALVVTGFLSYASPAQAQVFSTCDTYGEYHQGDWTLYNNIWGENPGGQCLHVNNINSWYVDANHTGGGIKSYPNTGVSPRTPLSQMASAGFTYNTSSAPVSNGDWWNWTADLWSTNNQDEIMVFTSWSGGRQAAGEGR